MIIGPEWEHKSVQLIGRPRELRLEVAPEINKLNKGYSKIKCKGELLVLKFIIRNGELMIIFNIKKD